MAASYYRLFKCHAAAVAFAVVFMCALGGPVEASADSKPRRVRDVGHLDIPEVNCKDEGIWGMYLAGPVVDGFFSREQCPATAIALGKLAGRASNSISCWNRDWLMSTDDHAQRSAVETRDECESVAKALNELPQVSGITCYNMGSFMHGNLLVEGYCTPIARRLTHILQVQAGCTSEGGALNEDEWLCTCPAGKAGHYCQYSDADTCNGAGEVSYDGSCTCTDPAVGTGPTCSEYTNADTCNDAGTAQPDGSCVCTDPTVGVGASCEYNNAATCNDAGTAQPDGSCVCADPTVGVGPSCEYSNADTCNANGIAQPDGSCDCTGLFYGPSCESGYSDAVTCRGAGAAQLDGSCECNGGFAGPNCQHSDAVTCSSRGVATDEGSCGCIESVFGANCEVARDTLCSGFGDPINEETCECDAGYMFVIASGTGGSSNSSSPGASLSSTCAPEPEPEEEPESIVLAAAVASSTSLFLLVCFYQQFIPKCCCVEWALNKLGCLKSCEMSYPTEDDADSTKVMISTAAGRKLAEKFECLQPALELCMIGGPTGGDDADLPTALCAPATKLYRRVKCGCCPTWLESCCETHGPNPDESNENVMFVPGAPVAQAAKGLFEKVQCCQPVSSQGSDENETATMDATWESPGADYLEVENSN